MITLSQVTAGYPGANPVLNEFTLRVEKGAFTILLGGSGSGKSTIFRLLSCELTASDGEMTLNGQSIRGLQGASRASHRRSIGLLSPGVPLIEDRTIEANINIRLELEEMSKKRRIDRLSSVLERFNLLSVRAKYPAQVSTSERQRATIARAVVTEPIVLLADEPAAHLDSENAREIAELLMHENLRGVTVLLGTHDPEFAARFKTAQVVRM